MEPPSLTQQIVPALVPSCTTVEHPALVLLTLPGTWGLEINTKSPAP